MTRFVVPTNIPEFMFPMLCEDKALKLIEIFIACDDFANAYQRWKAQYHPNQKPGPDSQLAPSEVMTILIFYHYSGAKCFQYYYRDWVQGPPARLLSLSS